MNSSDKYGNGTVENARGDEEMTDQEPLELTEDADVSNAEIQDIKQDPQGTKSGNQLNDMQTKLMRLQADFDNFRRRNAGAKQEAREETRKEMITGLLPIYDNFLRALRHSDEQEEYSALRNGLEGIRAQMESFFKSHGAEEISAAPGDVFDPNLHDAAGMVESDEAEDHTIAQEILKGFTIKGSVVRPAQVLVFTRKS